VSKGKENKGRDGSTTVLQKMLLSGWGVWIIIWERNKKEEKNELS
jgi:hypothetical protein